MARARNLKPGFFKNEALAELPFEYRILFAGLWTLADREGRLEDRPKRIRMEIFPADDVDCEVGLQALAQSGLVLRYEVDGARYIWIPTFLEHQKPHLKEVASTIPPHLGTGEHLPRSVPAPTEAVASPASCLNPHSLNPESLEKRIPGVASRGDSAGLLGAAALAKLKTQPLTLDEAKIPGGEETPAGILASVLRANGIKGNAFHPLVIDWSREGIDAERLKAAIAKARQRPGKEAGSFGCEYLDPILHDETKPAAEVHAEKASKSAAKSAQKAQKHIAESRAAADSAAPPPEWTRKFVKQGQA